MNQEKISKLREELINDGWTEQEVADFFSIYQVA